MTDNANTETAKRGPGDPPKLQKNELASHTSPQIKDGKAGADPQQIAQKQQQSSGQGSGQS